MMRGKSLRNEEIDLVAVHLPTWSSTLYQIADALSKRAGRDADMDMLGYALNLIHIADEMEAPHGRPSADGADADPV